MTRDPAQQPPRSLPERRESGSREASAKGSGPEVGSRPAEGTRPASNLPLRGRQLMQNDPFSQPGYTDSFYDAIGGHETFVKLIDVFYDGVATDPLLRPMYPEEDLGPAKRRFLMFLEQYWGGPGTYSQERGHPRLRMRHMPFRVTPEAKDRWLFHMRSAVDSLGLSPLHEGTLWDYMERAALMMVNSPSPRQGR